MMNSAQSQTHQHKGRGRLTGKIAIVAGAGCIGDGWGNGQATAVQFAREGATVHLIDKDEDALKRTASIIEDEGGRYSMECADVSVENDVKRAIASCVAAYSRIDILHNNVGVALPGSSQTMPLVDWERAFQINLNSALLTSRYAIRHMHADAGGSIINVSSISSIRVLAGLTYLSYPTSKAALNQMTKVMAVELASRRIRCNTIIPGFLNTPMVEQSVLRTSKSKTLHEYLKQRSDRIPAGHWGNAWDVAFGAVFLASDESRYITGIDLIIDGGASLLSG